MSEFINQGIDQELEDILTNEAQVTQLSAALVDYLGTDKYPSISPELITASTRWAVMWFEDYGVLEDSDPAGSELELSHTIRVSKFSSFQKASEIPRNENGGPSKVAEMLAETAFIMCFIYSDREFFKELIHIHEFN